MTNPKVTLLPFQPGDPAKLWEDYLQKLSALVAGIATGTTSVEVICACADAWRRFQRAFAEAA